MPNPRLPVLDKFIGDLRAVWAADEDVHPRHVMGRQEERHGWGFEACIEEAYPIRDRFGKA